MNSSVKILFIGVIFGLGYWGVSAMPVSDLLPIKKVKVDGLFKHVNTSQLQEKITNLVSGGFFLVDVFAIEQALTNISWISSASVRRIWPDTLSISIEEQDVIARWNKHGLLNVQGKIFFSDETIVPVDLPWLRGPEGMHTLVLRKYKEMAESLSGVAQKISLIEMDDRQAWRVVLNNGTGLMLGRNNISQALNRFVDVFGGSFSKNISDVAQIDLRYTNGFALKWKPEQVSVSQRNSSLQSNSQGRKI